MFQQSTESDQQKKNPAEDDNQGGQKNKYKTMKTKGSQNIPHIIQLPDNRSFLSYQN